MKFLLLAGLLLGRPDGCLCAGWWPRGLYFPGETGERVALGPHPPPPSLTLTSPGPQQGENNYKSPNSHQGYPLGSEISRKVHMEFDRLVNIHFFQERRLTLSLTS